MSEITIPTSTNDMKKLVPFLLLLLTFTSFGQEKLTSTLKTTGVSSIRVKPDLGILNISVSEIRAHMSDAIKALESKSNFYHDLLIKLGFKENEIKTTNFVIAKNRIYRDNRSIDSGYVASQNIRLTFTFDKKTIQQIVSEFSTSEKAIELSFEFEISDQLKQKIQAQLIEYAVKDGKEKANIIAKSAGLKLIKIKDITYGQAGSDHVVEFAERKQRFATSMVGNDNFQSLNFTPEDISMAENLTMVWIVN